MMARHFNDERGFRAELETPECRAFCRPDEQIHAHLVYVTSSDPMFDAARLSRPSENQPLLEQILGPVRDELWAPECPPGPEVPADEHYFGAWVVWYRSESHKGRQGLTYKHILRVAR